MKADASAVRVENLRQVGGPWLACELIRRLKLDEFLRWVMPRDREEVPWALTLVRVIARLCERRANCTLRSSDLTRPHCRNCWARRRRASMTTGCIARWINTSSFGSSPFMGARAEQLREFTEAYFTLETKLLPTMTIASDQIRTRIREGTTRPQWFASDVLKVLEQQLPSDAFCILGVTMTDLYSATTTTYVFGQASLRNRSGIFSFARFDPAFYDEPRLPDTKTLILRRSCHTLAHETCHIVGMQDYIYFACAVNGSNNLDENDSWPLHLCPVCLRKLHESLRFDPLERDLHLRDVYRRFGFTAEANWIERRLRTLTGKQAHGS